MKMKFMGNPNETVIDRQTNKEMFRFNENGEFITEDLRIIGRAYGHFDSLEIKDEVIPFADEEALEEVKEKKVITCKKCGETFESQGKFLAHSRTHKGDEK